MVSISLFCCYEKVFSHMNSWMIRKKLLKLYNMKKKNCSHLDMVDFTDASTRPQKVFAKILKQNI